jgi:uncharacterized protein (DUF2141 family)
MKTIAAYGTNLFIGLLLIFLASYIQAQELPVKITRLRSSKGNVIINVFKDQESYDHEKPYKQFTFKKSVDKNSMLVELKLEPGTYGITLVDDENENKKIDKNFIGMPKEGFGFSNFFMTKMKKPSFEDFKVDCKNHNPIDIQVKYM